MKKYIVLLVFITSNFLCSQDKKVEQFPVFPNCENKFNEALESCFHDEVQQKVFTNFRVPQSVTDNNFKGNFIVLFEVNQEGKFVMQYSDATYPELNEEIKRVFDEMDPIGPPTYAGNPTYSRYSIRIYIPLQDPVQAKEV